jgi:ComF family protein
VYEGVARDAVIAIKFGGLSSIAPVMAEIMSDCVSKWDIEVEFIVHVPLSSSRKKERGYDQAGLIAQQLSKLIGVPHERRALRRARRTGAQVDQPDESSRRRNVEGAFALGARQVEGPGLLVDDVVTTGATLSACARVLAEAGASPVYALTFARED